MTRDQLVRSKNSTQKAAPGAVEIAQWVEQWLAHGQLGLHPWRPIWSPYPEPASSDS